MLLSALSVLVVAQSSSEIPEGLMNNPVELKAEEKVAAVKLLVSGYQLVKQNQFDRFDRTNEYF